MGNDGVRRTTSRSRAGLLEYPQYTRPGRVPGLGGARGAALGRPRPDRPVAAGPGAAPDPRPPPRPPRAAGALTADEQALLDEFPTDRPDRVASAARSLRADLLEKASRHERNRSRRPRQPARRHPRLRPRRHAEGARPRGRGQPRAGPGVPGRRDPPQGQRRAARPSRSARSASASASSAPSPCTRRSSPRSRS